jgi:CelD/BcsL family acetyltransferase involved in cellulose biosynthesis
MPRAGSLNSRVLKTLAEIEAVAEDWRTLEGDCADPMGYFQTYDWCRNWVDRFCRDGAHAPHVVTVWQGDLLVALWPCMVVDSLGLKRLETLGVPHSQYCGILMRAETPRGDVAPLLRAAVRRSGCDVVLSRAVLAGSALDRVLDDEMRIGDDNEASVLDLSGFASPEDYVAQLGKLQKRNRNRRRNHLARLGDLRFDVLWPDDTDFAPLVAQCTSMKRRWLAETGRFSTGFAMTGYDAFLAALPGDGSRKEGACLSVLRSGDRVVALELGLLRQQHYYAYVGGFDWDLRQFSPGKVQMDFTVSWLIEQGVDSYDLLINPADYKASWTNRSVPVTSRAKALTWKGQVYASAWLPSVRPALKRLHARIPMMIERIVAVLRPAACMLLYV